MAKGLSAQGHRSVTAMNRPQGRTATALARAVHREAIEASSARPELVNDGTSWWVGRSVCGFTLEAERRRKMLNVKPSKVEGDGE